jgi:CPA1 family monovalent cation:H+ antiporter
MIGGDGLRAVEMFAVLVAIAALAGLVTTRLSMPYSVALVLAGLVVAVGVPPGSIEVPPDLILAVLIPGLVFEAAYKLDVTELRRTAGLVGLLAVPGVVITATVVAVIASVVAGLDLALGFLLGAIVSATDPVAVVELFKRLDAPCRLSTVVDAEALFNDGTGIVLFTIALHAVTGPIGLADGAVQFAATVVVSGIIGLVAGAAAVRLMALTTDRLVQATISVVAAYGTYLVALRLGESGIIATVMAGVVIGWAGDRGTLSRRTMAALDAVWSFAAYMISALTFLLIGMTVGPDLVLRAAPLIAAGYLAITVARAIVVYGLIGLTERALPGPSLLPVGHLHVMFWAGLRGAIATALVLALPTDLPQRELLTGAVYGIVLLTIVVQGTTAGWVIRRSVLGTAV